MGNKKVSRYTNALRLLPRTIFRLNYLGNGNSDPLLFLHTTGQTMLRLRNI